MEQTILTLCLQFGGTFALAVITIYLLIKNRKNGKVTNGYGKQLLDEMKSQNQNHLHAIEEGMNTGFDRIVDTLNNNDKQIIQLLGEIKGRLSK